MGERGLSTGALVGVIIIVVAGMGPHSLIKISEKQASLLSVAQKTSPTIITVPTDYPTIQEAIDAAGPGDVISVSSGTYYEQLVVDKPISLVGEDMGTTIIDTDEPATVVRVNADSVTISDLTIQNSGYFTEREVPVIEILGSYNSIENNLFCYAADVDSRIMYVREGADNNVIAYNVFREETTSPSPHMIGIWIGSSYNQFVGNVISADTALAISGSYNTILNNTMDNSQEVVIWGLGAGNCIIGNDADVSRAWIGIGLTWSRNCVVANNRITAGENPYAIAMLLDHAENTSLLNNEITAQNGKAILLSGSSNNVLNGNNILAGLQGVFLFHHSDNNEISNNDVEGGRSIVAHDSAGNKIWGNNFTGFPYDNTGQNQWDWNGRGNYWSLYREGATTFSVPPAGEDHYPLSGPITVTPVDVPEMPPPVELGPSPGEWIDLTVTGQEIIEGGTWFGKIKVLDGGSLTIRDGKLFDTDIEMSDESTLTIERTTISATKWNWAILTAPDSTVIIRDSDLHGAGFGFGLGLSMDSGTVVIENCVITDSIRGVNLVGASCGRIVGNEIYGNIKGIVVESSNVLAENNIIRDAIDGALYTSGDVENVVTSNNSVMPGGWEEIPEIPGVTIGPSGGFIASDKARLDVPPNALSATTLITVTQVSASPPSGYSIVGSAYGIEPIGTTFTLPATITLSYNEADLQAGWKEEDLAIWRKTDGIWGDLGGAVDAGANSVSVEITSLSEYAIVYAGVPVAEGIPIVYVVTGVVFVAVLALILYKRFR